MGKIGQSLASLKSVAPRLQRDTGRIVTWCAGGGAAVALFVVLLFRLLRGGWIEALLAGIAIGMAMLPEEFPVVLTVFLAMGAWRIGKVGVLTRRASAIETLGSATVLCTDKTGTLTENRMSVTSLWLPSGEVAAFASDRPIPEGFRYLLETAALASSVEPDDPMEMALHEAANAGLRTNRPSELLHTWPLRPGLLAMSNAWRAGDVVKISAKGAPEAISTLCQLTPDLLSILTDAVEAMAVRGIRVLAVAHAIAPDPNWAETQHSYNYELAGLVGLADPIRASVPAAVAQCRSAGIRVVMITGDHAATALAISHQAGIVGDEVLSGAEIAGLDGDELSERLKTVNVFARIMPEQKLRIVQALKASGEIVAMTGDGVNDAPSLKAAHIGIAMGKRGTDVAREASAIVLLDDDFESIVQSVRLGRRIYDNIRKAMAFIFAVHVPIAGLALLPLVSGLPVLFGPIHIALLEMVIDPVCALVFEAEHAEENIMRRPPRDPAERLFSLPMIVWSIFQGLVAFVILGALFFITAHSATPEAELRALTFFSLIATIIALILVNQSHRATLRGLIARPNKVMLYVTAIIATVSILILAIPPAQSLLQFGSIVWTDMALALGLGAGLLAFLEGCKAMIGLSVAKTGRLAKEY
jgi:Ca2+-transporting ATPase